MINKGEAITKILKEYAFINQVPVCSISDLSQMEAWLIIRLLDAEQTIEALEELINKREDNNEKI